MQHGRDAMDGRRRCIGLDLGTILRDAHIYFMGLRPIREAGTLLVGTILTILAKYFVKEDVPELGMAWMVAKLVSDSTMGL